MSEMKPERDYMALTVNERKAIERVRKRLREAERAEDGETAAFKLECAQAELLLITRSQWWRTR